VGNLESHAREKRYVNPGENQVRCEGEIGGRINVYSGQQECVIGGEKSDDHGMGKKV